MYLTNCDYDSGRDSHLSTLDTYNACVAKLYARLQRIPCKIFVGREWREIQNTITNLRLPNGSEWKMCLEKRGDDILFEKDCWGRFARHLRYADVLFFEYREGSYFHVVICDDNMLEIDYSNMRCDKEGEESDDEEGAETLNDSENPTQPRKKKKTNSNGAPSQSTERKINIDSDAATHAKIPGELFIFFFQFMFLFSLFLSF